MEFAVRQSSSRAFRAPTHRCTTCHETALALERRHVSPEKWGPPVVTEFYECDSCDARYAYSPADDRWRRLAT
jgi:hypothetical protein